MLVYGDLERTEQAREIASEVENRLSQYRQMPSGLQRHQALMAAFIRASELVQGAVDAEFHQFNADEVSERSEAGNAVLLVLAKAVAVSWDGGFTAAPDALGECQPYLSLLSDAGNITTRQAEGYAFYALYPESYIAAARASGLGADTLVIGIRSIGAGLGGLVAAGLGASPAVTVRPVGHPFQRQLVLGRRLAERLASHYADFAIVDEGPAFPAVLSTALPTGLWSRVLMSIESTSFPAMLVTSAVLRASSTGSAGKRRASTSSASSGCCSHQTSRLMGWNAGSAMSLGH